jgi:CarD family transcriptional regulator
MSMSFTVGQTVVHPHHGAAVIDNLEDRVFDGKSIQYLVLSAPDTDLTLRVPAAACEEIGIRECMGRDELDALLSLLGEEGEPPTGHWSRRLKRNQERLRSGEPSEVAIVLRDLTSKDGENGLSPAERRLRDQARSMLLGEMNAILGDETEAETMLDKALGLG